ncbi:anaerobic glycerol-3-phosphate dehydrogenase subunit GlpA [Propionicimonas sp.]|uniref:anaerobic glycerol-3-phosphate dehydrogenase subunit GlpA n=1 Tax=Propionicimonas sp. TaxID=1955623 RepID=UPI0018512932|nr:anaerobic glycerol-3-phosphate dehydrogenase subunit GlpA [Propionicimonas sp.]MBU3976360.1 anaerobic glycerol-3-phosphate dehydrogenase subunit A [Actinomycetota bacterium]MBA3022047.1 anaerobic glycerol-3-phosphate dehydrogenase subunit A [Propionicimonas sp.]MBU3987517.1 anaerobic glycerol-3-phosphate dehydrogenase subunit A [Actinomycetota bacterium]MBU4006538.1 anaerobic glycerol-3-phosphate dehydrogenase subunit A [Actinomycetota bacterium]MBU4065143.1 anaerobic glycerol-3-phosphate d
MRKLAVDVVVIGGGSTGAGVVRDVAMRGFSTVLVERADLGQGTTGRFHGLLHSGGRYVVSDPESARECASENEILTRIQAGAIESTGGYFVTCPGDDPTFADKFLAGAANTGVWAREVSVAEALRNEPRLNPGISRAIEVRDGTVDGWKLVWGAANSARHYGAQILTYHRVTKIETEAGRVTAVRCTSLRSGEEVLIECDFVLNCAGPWAGQIAAMAGAHPVEVVPGRGIMIAMNHRLVNRVVNRCIYPADGDILVPAHTVSIIGTTDVKVDDPDNLAIEAHEVQQMLDAGEVLIPGFRNSRALHAWAGARPLIKDDRVAVSDTRHMSRGMAVIDHTTRDGLDGMLTIGGGKLTTYRLMAEHIVDAMCDKRGEHRDCRTDAEPVPGSESGRTHLVSDRLHDREHDRFDEQIICECELMSRKMFTDALASQPAGSFDDLRRQLRLGMGPCQGGFCSVRATGIALDAGHLDSERANGLLRLFLKNRWIGLWPILYGDQVRQTALDNWIFQGTLDVEHLPQPTSEVVL